MPKACRTLTANPIMPDTLESTTALPLPPGPEQPMALDIDLPSQQAISRLLTQYGDIFRVRIPKRKQATYIVTNPDAVKQILVSNHSNYIKGRGFERVKMLLGNGIIVSDGDFWRRQRTMIQPAFSRKHIHRMNAMMQQVTQQLIPRWQHKADRHEALDISTEMSEFALELILRALIADDLDTLKQTCGENPFAFLTANPARNLAVAMKFRQLAPLIQSVIDRRRKHHEHHTDLLDALMYATDKQGKRMTDKELMDEVMTMIIAGHETSAGTLNWVWYELARHPQIEARLSSEASSMVHDGGIKIDDVTKLAYTKQVINETLRLYPPVWLFTRKAVADDSLAGFHIPAGTDIFLSPFFSHRDPACWDDAETFNPERFANDGKHLKHKYAFIPFSAGSRRCIGEYFSYIEMQTHLAILSTQFSLSLLPGQHIKIDPGINLRTKNRIMMTVHRRQD